MALCGYVQSAQLSAKALADEVPEPFKGKFGGNNMGGGNGNGQTLPGFTGKGLVFSAEAGANSEQGQSVKVLPDTHTITAGVSSCWASNQAEEDSTTTEEVVKTFSIDGSIKIDEVTSGASWSSSQGTSDSSAEKDGQQGVEVKDSAYRGKLGELCSCSCPQDDLNNFH